MFVQSVWSGTSRLLLGACLVLTALVGCRDREAEARAQLNLAIQAWNAGQLEESVASLDALVTTHGDTRAATEALQFKQESLARYAEAFDPDRQAPAGYVPLTAAVRLSLEKFHSDQGHFPASLDELAVSERGQPLDPAIVGRCKYERGLFDAGYKLDCTEASAAYRAAELQRRQISAKPTAGRSVRPSAHSPLNKNSPQLKKANVTWGKVLIDRPVPSGAFLAYYLNSNQPDRVVAHERTEAIAVNYAWKDFHEIPSEDFGAYWVGKIVARAPVTKRISINQSWSKTRLIINGYVVYEGGTDVELHYQFEPGSHLIEVEYVNNWHTTEFKVTIADADVKIVDASLLKPFFAARAVPHLVLYVGSVYESASPDLSIDVNIAASGDPVLIMLSSYSAVKWVLHNPNRVRILGLAYGSQSPGSEVTGDLPGAEDIVAFRGRIGTHRTEPSCRCSAGSFHCEGGSLSATHDSVRAVTGFAPSGFSGAYSVKALTLPEVVLSDALIASNRAELKELELARKQCQEKNSPDFEKLAEPRR